MRKILLATVLTILPAIAMAQTDTSTSTGEAQGIAESGINQNFAGNPAHESISTVPSLGTQIVTPTATCTIPITLQGVGLGIGLGGGTAYTVIPCQDAESARLAYDMGDKADAQEMLCLQPAFRKERAIIGQPCPAPFGSDGLTAKQQKQVDDHFAAVAAARPKVIQVAANPMAVERAKFCATLSPSKAEDRPYIAECLKDDLNSDAGN